jgi:hypothetical protein
MVRAILDDRKTQTRRVVKRVDRANCIPIGKRTVMHVLDAKGRCPYGVPGDRLWVRETVNVLAGVEAVYAADNAKVRGEGVMSWRDGTVPSIHMPRWASRLTLTITDVRVERLQDISEEDALAEGCSGMGGTNYDECESPSEEFRHLWDSINAKRGHAWATNPWVWAITFERTSTDA